MAEYTKIERTHHTFNPWLGCTKVSPGCDRCYAESWARRTGQRRLWEGERRRTTEQNWREPLRWNARGERDGRRHRVFCASLADVFDNQVPDEWRADLWKLIAATPALDWLLLTKRPQNIARMLPADWSGWRHVWLGATAENQHELDRRLAHCRSRCTF
jgi:protein gp37